MTTVLATLVCLVVQWLLLNSAYDAGFRAGRKVERFEGRATSTPEGGRTNGN